MATREPAPATTAVLICCACFFQGLPTAHLRPTRFALHIAGMLRWILGIDTSSAEGSLALCFQDSASQDSASQDSNASLGAPVAPTTWTQVGERWRAETGHDTVSLGALERLLQRAGLSRSALSQSTWSRSGRPGAALSDAAPAEDKPAENRPIENRPDGHKSSESNSNENKAAPRSDRSAMQTGAVQGPPGKQPTHVQRQPLHANGVLVVGRGPGSFSGIRVGIALAQGLRLAWNADILAIPSPLGVAAAGHALASRNPSTVHASQMQAHEALSDDMPLSALVFSYVGRGNICATWAEASAGPWQLAAEPLVLTPHQGPRSMHTHVPILLKEAQHKRASVHIQDESTARALSSLEASGAQTAVGLAWGGALTASGHASQTWQDGQSGRDGQSGQDGQAGQSIACSLAQMVRGWQDAGLAERASLAGHAAFAEGVHLARAPLPRGWQSDPIEALYI